MIIFESLLTTFKASVFFMQLYNIKNCQEPSKADKGIIEKIKIEQPALEKIIEHVSVEKMG